MKTKIILLALTCIFSACSVQTYLPTHDQVDINQYGSYLYIYPKTGNAIGGELIALDSNSIILLERHTRRCVTVSITDVKRFSLRYAMQRNYFWAIPILTLGSFTHGLYGFITVPVNLLATTVISSSANNAYRYSEKTLTYEQLKMFARFPQGIPQGVDVANIK